MVKGQLTPLRLTDLWKGQLTSPSSLSLSTSPENLVVSSIQCSSRNSSITGEDCRKPARPLQYSALWSGATPLPITPDISSVATSTEIDPLGSLGNNSAIQASLGSFTTVYNEDGPLSFSFN